ncbi:hypothetical protein SCLCIDRAFT_1214996 [Scleroderma citrinum Foug A]|uniref:Uncharacterized protein n=1 Tax=Scleroderma citrinum Foug A TaxID=1036808 RepID=A0A0C3ABZ3_9AGAM|nr:hypothetical protein SCLCIDRAFT_1214996 [Scleroderma citrinum Foug A]
MTNFSLLKTTPKAVYPGIRSREKVLCQILLYMSPEGASSAPLNCLVSSALMAPFSS